MYIPPRSLLSRLLGAAWTVLVIAVLLWLAVRLLTEVWIWVVVIAFILLAVRAAVWWRHIRREYW